MMAAATILDFLNREILLAIGVERAETHQHAKFCQNRSINCKDIKIFRFLPRDALLSAVYAVVVCLSVCLSVCLCVSVCVCVSVTLRYCIKTAKRRITQIKPHDSPLTLDF